MTCMTYCNLERKTFKNGLPYCTCIPISGCRKGLIIRTTTRPSRKCELMKLSLPLVSFMYADAAFTVAAPKYWNSLPDELRTMSSFMSFKCRLHTYMVSL